MPPSSRPDRGAGCPRVRIVAPRRGPRRPFRPELPSLEPRTLLSSLPSADEQYLLQLINRARADPPAEARRLLASTANDPVLAAAVEGSDLSAFAERLGAAGASPPLAFNTRLIAAARDRNAMMLAANDQRHAPGGFLVDPGYGLVAGDGRAYYPVGESPWAAGENLFAYSRNVAGATVKDYADYFHAGFLIDWGNPDFGHQKNLLAPGPSQAEARGTRPFSEIGLGLLVDANPTAPPPADPQNPANRGLDVGPVLVTQEFAWKAGDAFLTGAVYRDGDGDAFYTPGEGVGGVTIRAVGLRGEGTYEVQTWGSGGYSLQLPPGSYHVTASGGSAPTRTEVIAIGQDNVGWDIRHAADAADRPVPADYDGDGLADAAVYRTSTGRWHILGSRVGDYTVEFGQPDLDVPIPADYDGDGRADLALYRPSTGLSYILGTSSPGRIVPYAAPEPELPVVPFAASEPERPAPAVVDAGGRSDAAPYRPLTTQRPSLRARGGAANGRKVRPGRRAGNGRRGVAVGVASSRRPAVTAAGHEATVAIPQGPARRPLGPKALRRIDRLARERSGG